ncbi:MAG: DUF3006 domain-containing protein [Candidatus Limnocylindria bacterium]
MSADDPLRGVVDRLTDGLAVVLVGDDEIEHHVPLDRLPAGVEEGSVVLVRMRDGELEVIGLDRDETETRRHDIQRRISRLRKRSGGRFGKRADD